jgi:hypothetical protein
LRGQADNVARAKATLSGADDLWTWTAIDSETMLIIMYLAGGLSAVLTATHDFSFQTETVPNMNWRKGTGTNHRRITHFDSFMHCSRLHLVVNP